MAAERRAWRERQKAKQGDTGGAGDDGTEQSGEDQLVQRARDLQADNKASLQHSIQVARQAADVGAATAQKLNEQTGTHWRSRTPPLHVYMCISSPLPVCLYMCVLLYAEQLNRMDNALDETNDSLGRSERILRGMKSFTGAIANWFTSSKDKDKKKSKVHHTPPEQRATPRNAMHMRTDTMLEHTMHGVSMHAHTSSACPVLN